MIELIEQFQNETGIYLFGGWSYQVINGMITPPLSESPWMKFTQWLCDKLTWKPVSEPPKEGQIVFAMIPTGWVAAQYLNGKFYIDDGFTFGYRISGVTYWLPIPPALEGD